MLTPEQINQIRVRSGLPISNNQEIQQQKQDSNFVGKYDHLKDNNNDDFSFFEEVGNALNKRFGNIKDIIFKKGASGEINPASVGIQSVGQIFGGVGDVIGAGVQGVIGQGGRKALSSTGEKIINTDATKKIISSYQGFKEQNPELAGNIEALVNILSFAPATALSKPALSVAKTSAETALKTGSKIAIKAGKSSGRIIEKTGEKLYKTAIPLNMKEASVVQTYKANNSLLKRLFNPLDEQPRTQAITALNKGLAGSEDMIGVQAKREAKNLWDNKIKPAVQSINEQYNVKNAIDNIEKQVSNIAEESRKKNLQKAVQALKEDYKGVASISYERAQEIKSGLDKFIPDKAYKGQPIASSFREVQKMLADDIRANTYKQLKDVDIRTDYLDYGNLLGLQKIGQKAMTGGALRGGAGSFISTLKDRAVIPTFTLLGKNINKAGKLIQSAIKK